MINNIGFALAHHYRSLRLVSFFKRVHCKVHALIARPTDYQQHRTKHSQLPVTFFASEQNSRSHENSVICDNI